MVTLCDVERDAASDGSWLAADGDGWPGGFGNQMVTDSVIIGCCQGESRREWVVFVSGL